MLELRYRNEELMEIILFHRLFSQRRVHINLNYLFSLHNINVSLTQPNYVYMLKVQLLSIHIAIAF